VKSLQYLAWVSIIIATAAASPAFAQPAREPPARIGNIWDGRAHEPDPATVDSDLKALGDAPKPGRERATNDEVEDLYQQLIQEEARNGQETASRNPRPAALRQASRPSPR
jgi:hypothetical protein